MASNPDSSASTFSTSGHRAHGPSPPTVRRRRHTAVRGAARPGPTTSSRFTPQLGSERFAITGRDQGEEPALEDAPPARCRRDYRMGRDTTWVRVGRALGCADGVVALRPSAPTPAAASAIAVVRGSSALVMFVRVRSALRSRADTDDTRGSDAGRPSRAAVEMRRRWSASAMSSACRCRAMS